MPRSLDTLICDGECTLGEYLKTACDLVYHHDGVYWFNYTNCHYILFNGEVYEFVGYPAKSAFADMAGIEFTWDMWRESDTLRSRDEHYHILNVATITPMHEINRLVKKFESAKNKPERNGLYLDILWEYRDAKAAELELYNAYRAG